MHAHIHAFTYIHTYTCIYIYIYTYIYVYIITSSLCLPKATVKLLIFPSTKCSGVFNRGPWLNVTQQVMGAHGSRVART